MSPGGVMQGPAREMTDTEKAAAARGRTVEPGEAPTSAGSAARIADANRVLGYGNQAALATQGSPVDEEGGPVRLATLQRATLVNAGGGDGRYWLALADPYGESPEWVRDPSQPDGRYVLDLKALEPVLRKRVPGAYRPY